MESALSKGVLPGQSDMGDMSAKPLSRWPIIFAICKAGNVSKIKKDQDALMEMSRNALNMSEWQAQIASEARPAGNRSNVAQMQEALRQAILKSAEALNSLSMTPPQTLSGLMRQFDNAAQSAGKSLDDLGENSDLPAECRKAKKALMPWHSRSCPRRGSWTGRKEGKEKGNRE